MTGVKRGRRRGNLGVRRRKEKKEKFPSSLLPRGWAPAYLKDCFWLAGKTILNHCHTTMPLSLKTTEVQIKGSLRGPIKGDQWNKRFRTVQVYWTKRSFYSLLLMIKKEISLAGIHLLDLCCGYLSPNEIDSTRYKSSLVNSMMWSTSKDVHNSLVFTGVDHLIIKHEPNSVCSHQNRNPAPNP